MHKEPKKGNPKAQMEHEAKESSEMEMKERKEDPKHEKEEAKEMGNAAHLKHPQIKQKHLVNDLAYHLHHPQIKGGPQGAKLPPSKPRG